MSFNTLSVGICGLGTVGAGTVNVLRRNHVEICNRAGCDIAIAQIGARRDHPECDTSSFNVTRDIFDVAKNPEVDLLIELIGGTTVAKELVMMAIDHGKHIVTANKALIAEHGHEIFTAAANKGVNVHFEAAIAGGIPIVKALREGLAANRIEWLVGIINGTGNFILTEMGDKGTAFDDVLAEAQALGYAEADPSFDVEGTDAAHKLVILASLAFGIRLDFSKVYVEGITNITPEDIESAASLGYRIKHLGIAKRTAQGIEMRVHPTLIPKKRLIANVDGVMNSVVVKGDAVGSTMYCGAGAGAEPTASAVIADIIDIAKSSSVYSGYGCSELTPEDILTIDNASSAYYLRLEVEDKPGVLSSVTSVLSELGISIEAVNQQEPQDDQVSATIAVLTDVTREDIFNRAVESLEALPSIKGAISRLRVESMK